MVSVCQEDNTGKHMIGHIRYGQLPGLWTAVWCIRITAAVFKLEIKSFFLFNVFRLFTYPKGNISNYEMFISPQDVLFLFLLSVSSDVQETALLILKRVYVEQGGYFLHMLWLVGARHSNWVLHHLRSNLKRNKESGLSWCFGNTGKESDTSVCSGFLRGQNFKAGSHSMTDPISLVGVQGVEHFFPSFGGASLMLAKIVRSHEMNWSQESWARCSFACFATSPIPFQFLYKKN